MPVDVENRIRTAASEEQEGSLARSTLNRILENIELAREQSVPMCQDTGTTLFYVDHPVSRKQNGLKELITEAVREATAKCYLRPNTVDVISGKNVGDGTGTGAPYISFKQWEREDLRIRLMLKGGGSENVGVQYKLPDSRLNAGRDLEGVRKCIIDAIVSAQGKGCAPGTVGAGIGGDRMTSYRLSKEQFFRLLDDENENAALAKMESKLTDELNSLGIGPMGFGGKTTVLGVKLGAMVRHPACFFVSVSYMCWACRRRTMIIDSGGGVTYD